MNRVLPKKCAIEIPESFVRAKLIRAMKTNPLFKTLVDNMLIAKPDEWAELTVEQLYRQLQNVSANSRDMEVRGPQMPRQDQQQDAVANMAQATPRNRVREEPKRKSAAPKGVCYDFYEKGVCDKQKCRFKHERPSVQRSLFGPRPQPQPPQFQQRQQPQQQQQQQQQRPEAKRPATPFRPVTPSNNGTRANFCNRCGLENHKRSECKWTGKCTWCGRVDSHKESQCREKKDGKPRAHLVVVDGEEVNAHMLFVDDELPVVPRAKRAKGDTLEDPIEIEDDDASVGQPGKYFSDDEPEAEWELCSSSQCDFADCLAQHMPAYRAIFAPLTSYSPRTPEFVSYSPTSPTYSPITPTYSSTSPRPQLECFSPLPEDVMSLFNQQ